MGVNVQRVQQMQIAKMVGHSYVRRTMCKRGMLANPQRVGANPMSFGMGTIKNAKSVHHMLSVTAQRSGNVRMAIRQIRQQVRMGLRITL